MIITGVDGFSAASLSIDMRGVMPVPPPINTWTKVLKRQEVKDQNQGRILLRGKRPRRQISLLVPFHPGE